MRLSAIELLEQARQENLLDAPCDVIFATSLLSVADWRALLPRTWQHIPIVLYMHENQAAYPQGPQAPDLARQDLQFALTNLTSILAADRVIWNSAWNRDSFLDGMAKVLRHAPDTTLLKCGSSLAFNWQSHVVEKSDVIWPPVELPPASVKRVDRCHDDVVRVLWPHRWEHDKGPDDLLALARQMQQQRPDIRWVILGEQYRDVPPALMALQQECAAVIDHVGYLPDREAYWAMLHRCDWVLSTAHHEFFGIAVVEALFAGCLPWLPDRLSYPELLPLCAHGLSPLQGVVDSPAIRQAIRLHLRDAQASYAVGRLDDALVATA